MLLESNSKFLGAMTTILLLAGSLSSCSNPSHLAEDISVATPDPFGVVPSERQLKWHELEFYCFVHFTMNTFTDIEWGYGDESLDLFDPTDFSAEQIVTTAKNAGMKGLILTCKHHDGFCLWPSKYTEHSVKNTPWKNGEGDMVREFADACAKHGVKFGVYLSPWDRNHADYGRPEYIDYYRDQLRELLTDYGPVFEVWWDGANGGDGFYGGAREERRIDRGTYYGWEETAGIVRRLQPDACIFSDAGPDVRWNGNEHGVAGEPCWATYTPEPREGESKASPGTTKYWDGNQGHRDGTQWIPAESDVSIRPGWFYHANQDDKVRTPENLIDLYFKSIGRGSSFLLNLPPDRRGRIHEKDVASLTEFKKRLDGIFDHNLAVGAKLKPCNVRGGAVRFSAMNLLDGDRNTYWATDDGASVTPVRTQLELELAAETTFNVVDLREFVALGHRVYHWQLEQWQDGAWVEFGAGEAIGNRRLWRGENVTTTRVRLTMSGPVGPALSEFGLYLEEGSSGRTP